MTVPQRIVLFTLLSVAFSIGTVHAQTGSVELDSLVGSLNSGELQCQDAIDAFRIYRSRHSRDAYANLYFGRAFDRTATLHGECQMHSDSILALTDSALRYYGIARKLSPNLHESAHNFSINTLVGHLYGTRAMWYLYQKDLTRARAELAKGKSVGGFPPAVLEWARQTLQMAEPNAIIAGFGDDDCFPYWYLQLVEGVRPDVSHISMALIVVPWYQQMIASGYYGATTPVAFPLSKASGPFDLDESVLQEVSDKFDDAATIDTFRISSDTRERLARKLGRKVPAIMITRAFRPNDEANEAIGSLAFVQWHSILKANGWKRPIYFAWPENVYRGNDSLVRQGPLLSEILPVTNRHSPVNWVDVPQLRSVLANTPLLKLQIANEARTGYLDLLLGFAIDRANEELVQDSSQATVDAIVRDMQPLVAMWPDATVDGYASLITGLSKLSGVSVERELKTIAAQLKKRVAKSTKQFSRLHYVYALTLNAQHDCTALTAFWKSLAWIDRDDLDEENTDYYDAIKAFVEECE